MRLGDEALQRDTKGIFRFNAGKEGKSVPDYNPYTIRRCRDCDVAKGELVFVPDNEVCAACKIVRALAKADIKQTRVDAKPLQGTSILTDNFFAPIRITRESIKEWTNQPHKHFRLKNLMLLDIREAIANATYLGTTDNHKGIPRAVQSHVFETTICGEKSFILVREYDWGEFVLHSISDSENIYKHIKKK